MSTSKSRVLSSRYWVRMTRRCPVSRFRLSYRIRMPQSLRGWGWAKKRKISVDARQAESYHKSLSGSKQISWTSCSSLIIINPCWTCLMQQSNITAMGKLQIQYKTCRTSSHYRATDIIAVFCKCNASFVYTLQCEMMWFRSLYIVIYRKYLWLKTREAYCSREGFGTRLPSFIYGLPMGVLASHKDTATSFWECVKFYLQLTMVFALVAHRVT